MFGRRGAGVGRRHLRRLKDILHQEGRTSALETCLDSPATAAEQRSLAAAPGVTCWDEAAAVRAQLHTLGELHAAAEGGSGVVFLPADPLPAAEQVADWLARAWSETDVIRLRLLHACPAIASSPSPAARVRDSWNSVTKAGGPRHIRAGSRS